MGIPFRGFEFSTTINARPEKAKETDTSFDVVPGVRRRALRSNKKAGTEVPAFESRDRR
jgi:hypothetical protein